MLFESWPVFRLQVGAYSRANSMKWTFTAISRIILGIHPIIMTCRAQHNFLGSEWPVDDSKGTPTDTHTHTSRHREIGCTVVGRRRRSRQCRAGPKMCRRWVAEGIRGGALPKGGQQKLRPLTKRDGLSKIKTDGTGNMEGWDTSSLVGGFMRKDTKTMRSNAGPGAFPLD